MNNVEERLKSEIRELKSKYGYLYAGYPNYMALFGRDSLISSWQLANFDHTIGIKTLEALSKLQGKENNPEIGEEEGKIPHEYYDNNKFYEARKKQVPWLISKINYFSVDSTPLFLVVMKMIEKASKRILYTEYKNTLVGIYKYLIKNITFNGLLSYNKAENGKGLRSQSWRDGIGYILESLKSPVATVGVQGYAYYGLEYLEGIADKLDFTKPNKIREIKDKIRAEVYEKFWDEKTSYFALALDGDGKMVNAITTDPGHLLFSGILSRKIERNVIDILFDSKMSTDYGIRTLSVDDKKFDPFDYQRGSIWPQDNWIIAQGLKMRGYDKEYKVLREAILSAYETIGYMPEYYSVDKSGKLIKSENLKVRPCYPQAWSTGALIDFLDIKNML